MATIPAQREIRFRELHAGRNTMGSEPGADRAIANAAQCRTGHAIECDPGNLHPELRATDRDRRAGVLHQLPFRGNLA